MKIQAVTFGHFRLDGGAMFGSVPKNLWSKLIAVDEENCIPLAARGLLVRMEERVVLIDVGMGEKWNDKAKAIFGVKNAPRDDLPFRSEEITDIILTHLHFDHAGGISSFGPEGNLVLTYPQARVHLQRANWENANCPSIRERASYLPENVDILKEAQLLLIDGDCEILPGITVHRVDGHTRGQQWVELSTGAKTYLFTSDVIPTSRHVPLPYTMGYDICTETMLIEKKAFLDRAIEKDAIVVFQHDPDCPAGKIHVNEKGHFAVKEKVEIE